MNRWDDATDYADWQRYQREVTANAAAVERDLFATHWTADRKRHPRTIALALLAGMVAGYLLRLVGLGG